MADPEKISQSGVIHTSFSDHCMIFCTQKTHKSVIGVHNNISTRSMKNYSKEDFQANLLAADWTPVNLSDNSFFYVNCRQYFSC